MKIAILSFSLLILACGGENKSTESIPELTGDLQLRLVDSYHIGDSTSILDATIGIHVDQPGSATLDTSFTFPESSTVGNVFEIVCSHLPRGGYNAIFSITRPFIIFKAKDSIGGARFLDSSFAMVSPNLVNRGPQIEIWAYRLNHLVVYFNENIDYSDADNIISAIGATILERKRSIQNGELFYRISTSGIGDESDIMPVLKNTGGVDNVYFEIYGHSYF